MRVAARAVTVAAALLPGALVVALAFQSGGFFPSAWSLTAAGAAVIVALRIVLARRPFAGVGRSAGIVAGALAVLGAWMLISVGWSHAPVRGLFAFERLLAYGLVFLAMASLPGGVRAAWTLRATALGIGIVSIAALVPRFAPDIHAVQLGDYASRLTWPIDYWNSLGLLAGCGLILCLHLVASTREPWWVRVGAVAFMPPAACALYLTFSRGAIAATAAGLVVYVLLGRPRGLITAAASAGLATAIAVVKIYDAGVLAQDGATISLQQAHHFGRIIVLCSLGGMVARAILLPVDAWLDGIRVGPTAHKAARIGLGAAVVAAVAVLLVAGAPGWASHQVKLFLHQDTPGSTDLRNRLLVVSANGRVGHWRVSLHGFERHPWEGTGAGTFANEWARHRRELGHVLNAHSLYIETLGELGIPGFVALLVAIGGLLVALAWRARGPDRGVAAATFAATLAWAGHAGVDWDWQLAAVTIWVFGLGGAVLARPVPDPERQWGVPRPARIVLALVVLALAIAPLRTAQSETAVRTAIRAFWSGDCTTAVDRSLSALDDLPIRTEPRELLAYCDVRAGEDALAVRAIDAAVDSDPDNWQVAYSQALVYAAVGKDPRPAAARAALLNPLDQSARKAKEAFATGGPKAWDRRARRLPLSID